MSEAVFIYNQPPANYKTTGAFFMAKRKDIITRIADMLTSLGKTLKSTPKATSGAVVAAIMGGLLKATALTQTFPDPFDTLGNVILFVAVLLVALDIAKGGLFD
jgi:hypothetical protein